MATAAANAVGVAVAMLAWYSAAQAVRPADQSIELGVAVGALALAGLGDAYGVTRGRRALNRQRKDTEDAVRSVISLIPDRTPAPTGGHPLQVAERGDALVASPEMSMYHKENCPLVGGKHTDTQSASDHRQAGRRPCGVCGP